MPSSEANRQMSNGALFELHMMTRPVDEKEANGGGEQATFENVADVIKGFHRIAEYAGAKHFEAMDERNIECKFLHPARQPGDHEKHAGNRQRKILHRLDKLFHELESF